MGYDISQKCVCSPQKGVVSQKGCGELFLSVSVRVWTLSQ